MENFLLRTEKFKNKTKAYTKNIPSNIKRSHESFDCLKNENLDFSEDINET